VAAAERLQDLNPEIRLIPQAVRLSEANAASLLGGHDLILDTTDNVATRLLINRMAVQLNIPLISGAVLGWAGHVAHLAGQPCYACLYPEVEQADADVACSVSGVMGSVAGIIGSWQATLAIRALCGLPDDLRGDMLVIHAAAPSMRRIRIRPVADCPVCGTEHR
jgi:molybdopterin/thiamine biosynthesis adenylyltransferase